MLMSFLSELHPYEVVILAGGCLIFAVALLLFVILVITGKLSLPFAIAIVMIGFPSYTKIEISKSGVTLEKNVHELLRNPTNNALRENITIEVAKLSARPLQDPKLLTTVAQAQIALGDNAAAEANVNKVLQVALQMQQAVDLKKRIELDRNLEQLTAQVEANPNDQAARTQLGNVVSNATGMQIASPVTITNVARAHAALGNQAQARENVNTVLKISPNFQPAATPRNKMAAPAQTGAAGPSRCCES